MSSEKENKGFLIGLVIFLILVLIFAIYQFTGISSKDSSQPEEQIQETPVKEESKPEPKINVKSEKEKISQIIEDHFEAISWKDKEAYLKTLDESSEEFYKDRSGFFEEHVLGGSGMSAEISSIDTEIVDTQTATSKIRVVLKTNSALLGELEQKSTITYNLSKTEQGWKISSFTESSESKSSTSPQAILNVTSIACRTDKYGIAEVVGTVENIGDAAAYSPKAYVDLKYNGEVVDTGLTYLQRETLYPGQVSSFDRSFVDPPYWDSCSAWASE